MILQDACYLDKPLAFPADIKISCGIAHFHYILFTLYQIFVLYGNSISNLYVSTYILFFCVLTHILINMNISRPPSYTINEFGACTFVQDPARGI